MSRRASLFLLAGASFVILAGFWLVTTRNSNIATPVILTTSETTKKNYQSISASSLNDMLTRKDFFLINVHIPYAGEIQQTDAFIAYNKITSSGKLPTDKKAKIVLYCRTGMMSSEAAASLAGAGYKNIYNLEGGMINWEKEGYQIITKSN